MGLCGLRGGVRNQTRILLGQIACCLSYEGCGIYGIIFSEGVRYFGEIMKGERGVRLSNFGLRGRMLKGKGENAQFWFLPR